MRYTLRNQDKIKSHFGEDGDILLKRILDSLDSFFKSKYNIDDFIFNEQSQPYPILSIADAHHTSNIVSFYIIRNAYDVYHLAFKEFIG